MGTIQSNIGLITGIDIQKTVDQLIAVSGTTRDRLQNKVKDFKSQQVSINSLTAQIIGVQLQSTRLGDAAILAASTVTSALPSTLSASSTGSPRPGNYSVQALQTAQTATASSATFTSATDTLQSGDFTVRTGGFVDSAASIDDLRGGAGIARGKIQITDRSGATQEIDLRFAATTDDILKAINSATGIRVSAKANGDRIVLSDLTGQSTSNLQVQEVGGGRTASDLGLGGINVNANSATGEDISFIGNSTRLSTLRDGRGIAFGNGNDLSVTLKDGSTLNIDANSVKNPTSVGQLISNINAVDSTKLVARLSADGNGFELVDKTTGTGSFSASGKLADQLGFTGVSGTSGTITGTRVQNTLQGPLLSSLRGGQGVGNPGLISITNRAGTTTSVNLSGAVSLRDVIDRINNSGSGVTASFNRSRTGLVLQDVTGSSTNNLVVADGDSNNTASNLNIAINDSKNSVDSGALGLQYVSEATEVSKLNQGRGISLGSFTLTNSAGKTKSINITAATKTVGDVITAINDNVIGVQAKLNDSGDGILVTDTSTGSGSFSIKDDLTGTSALDLGIRATGTSVAGIRKEINGSQTFKLSLNGTETLSQVVDKINSSNGPLTASLLTSGPSTVRILFTSRASGAVGRIFADGDSVGLNVNSSGLGRDAIIAVGATPDSGGTLVRSSSNVVSNAIDGLSLTVNNTSANPIDVTVASSSTSLEKNLQLFVDQFNKVRDSIDSQTSYDQTTQATGLLFGNPEVLRSEQTLARFVSQRTFTSGKVQSLSQLGISIDGKGKLSFDSAKLAKTLQSNPEDVKAYLTDTKTGFSVRAKATLDTLVGEKNSALVNRAQALQKQIDLTNSRIDSQTKRLDAERTRLLNQFYTMESNISKIKNSGNAINQIGTLSTTTSTK